MGSLEQPKLPIIDLTKKNLEPSNWESTRQKVVDALEEHSCFIATYDKVPLELFQAVFDVSKEVHNLSLETKNLNTSHTPSHGYVGQKPFIPLYEALGIERSTTLEGVEKFTNLMWPSGNQRFSETAFSYAKLVAELDQLLMKMVAETYGIEKHYEPLQRATSYLLKLFKYRPPKENEKNIGIFPHTDYSFMTILQQYQVGGVQVKTKDGQWISLDPMTPSSFIVMAGDGCMVWTNGRIKSIEHSVIINEERYSVGLFTFIRDLKIEVPEELVDEEHPLQYKPFDHYKYVHFISSEEAKKFESPLNSYCGVEAQLK